MCGIKTTLVIGGMISVIDPISNLGDISHLPTSYRRVVLLDPTDIYNRLYSQEEEDNKKAFSHYKRRNTVQMSVIFPEKKDGLCDCGCGQELNGRRRRWATDDCRDFAFTVHQVISGETSIIRKLFNKVLGKEACLVCDRTDNDIPRKYFKPEYETDPLLREKLWNKEIKEMANKIHVEHIVPVHKGGGGCWLSNYQLLCEDCHKVKTKEDRRV